MCDHLGVPPVVERGAGVIWNQAAPAACEPGPLLLMGARSIVVPLGRVEAWRDFGLRRDRGGWDYSGGRSDVRAGCGAPMLWISSTLLNSRWLVEKEPVMRT